MCKTKYLLVIILIISCCNLCFSQIEGLKKDPWVLGFYINTINDSGNFILKPFKTSDYNFKNPFKIAIEKRFFEDYGIELSGSTNSIINETTLTEEVDVLSFDLVMKYYASNLFLNPRRAIVEGYLFSGIGYTSYSNDFGAIFINLGSGINFFITENIRFALRGIVRLPLSNINSITKFLQIDVGFVYRL